MKIYRGEHLIESRDKINDVAHIPLCYMEKPREKSTSIDFQVMSDYDREGRVIALPYTTYKSFDTVLFDINNQKLDQAKILHRTSNASTYYLIPKNNKIEEPIRFSYQIKIKKFLPYFSDLDYNLKIGCIDKDSNLEVSKKLISIFSDANIRGVAPSNVTVNNGDLSIQSLSDYYLDELDLIFIQTPDGLNYYDGNRINFKTFEDHGVNVWLLIENHTMFVEEDHEEVFLTTDIATTRPQFKVDKKFREPGTIATPEGVEDISLFSEGEYQVLVRHKEDKHFLMMSHISSVEYISENARGIYELLLYTYMNSYRTSRKIDSWIYKTIPDYKINVFGAVEEMTSFEEKIDIENLFEIKERDAVILDVDIESQREGIKYFVSEYYIDFQLEEGFQEKKENTIVAYLPNKNIAIYDVENSVYENYKKPELLNYTVSNNELKITLSSFTNSKNGIYIPNNVTFSVPVNERVESVVRVYIYNENGRIIPLSFKDDSKNDLIAIVKVDFYSSNSVEIYDIRRQGGGLKECEEDNFNMLDIGSSEGRPYRLGGAMIIEVPKRFERYREQIEAQIKEHKSADAYFLLRFV